jgi:hypothetical protein
MAIFCWAGSQSCASQMVWTHMGVRLSVDVSYWTPAKNSDSRFNLDALWMGFHGSLIAWVLKNRATWEKWLPATNSAGFNRHGTFSAWFCPLWALGASFPGRGTALHIFWAFTKLCSSVAAECDALSSTRDVLKICKTFGAAPSANKIMVP